QKDTEARYQTAADLMADLKALKQKLKSHGDRADVDWEDKQTGLGRRPNSGNRSTREQSVSRGLGRAAGKTAGAANLAGQIRQHRKSLVLGLGAIVLAAAAILQFSAGSAGKTIESLAVLPFVNASSDPDLDYLSDGIADTLTRSLSRLPDVT